MFRSFLKSVSVLTGLVMMTNLVFAQSSLRTYDSATGALGLMMYISIACVYLTIFIVGLGLNIWMMIDALKRTEAVLPQKTLWIVVFCFSMLISLCSSVFCPGILFFIAPIIYYFVEKRRMDGVRKIKDVEVVK